MCNFLATDAQTIVCVTCGNETTTRISNDIAKVLEPDNHDDDEEADPEFSRQDLEAWYKYKLRKISQLLRYYKSTLESERGKRIAAETELT